MFGSKKILAVVPARGGSKSIPKKNLSKIKGKSLIQIVAEVIQGVDFIDIAILSTDDPDIVKEGKQYNLNVPFLRPAELSGDFANSLDVWRHALLLAEEEYSCRFDYTVLLEPTSPLRVSEDVSVVIRELIDNNRESVITISSTPAHFSPQKTLIYNDCGTIDFYHSHGKMHSIRQTIPKFYHRNGVCYGVSRDYLLTTDSIISATSFGVLIDRPLVNIDEPFDLLLADFLMR